MRRAGSDASQCERVRTEYKKNEQEAKKPRGKKEQKENLMDVSKGRPTHQKESKGRWATRKVSGVGAGWMLLLFASFPASAAAFTDTEPCDFAKVNTSPFWAPHEFVDSGPWTSPWPEFLEERRLQESCLLAAGRAADGDSSSRANAAADTNLCILEQINRVWSRFQLLVIWPVWELIPLGKVDDPLFNWTWLVVWGYFVVTLRMGLDSLIKIPKKRKNRKSSKQNRKTELSRCSFSGVQKLLVLASVAKDGSNEHV